MERNKEILHINIKMQLNLFRDFFQSFFLFLSGEILMEFDEGKWNWSPLLLPCVDL